ncbi:RNA polymerase sigma factor [Eisenbergiella tayi]|uniref:RNA polymerase sigma factor n=1 Tax=Eisenbergiella tayi TaxID=1432052 RepID=UPI000848A074|nr:sigma-70 family RNA polymerase sigma factor [Eisenbergiella tayi]ODR28287.1 RNA polymerase subunit sigma-70 [Eisenbergiella tayi]
MKNKYRVPDFRHIYPEASEEVIEVLRRTERKMQYQRYDLKVENYMLNREEETVTVVPSREDSLERLLELGQQFIKEQLSVEEEVIRIVMYEKLHNAIQKLEKEERGLIINFYYQKQSDREIALQLGISQKAVNKQRHKILTKLRMIIKKL